jgi:hypothetical protein
MCPLKKVFIFGCHPSPKAEDLLYFFRRLLRERREACHRPFVLLIS